MIKNTMSLCDKSGQFLFQVMPDKFPHGRLTLKEMLLWEKFYDEQNQRQEARRR
jgi:hypothetical protein